MGTAQADQLLHPVQQLLEAAGSALDDAGDPLLVGLTDGELDRALVAMEAVISRMWLRQLALVAEARSRNRAGAGGAANCARWLSLLLQADSGDAARRLRHAAVLDAAAADPVTEPLTADAREGRSLVPQAVIAARAVAALPADVPAAGRAAAAVLMRRAARELDPEQLNRVAERLIEVADPDGAQARLAGLLERQDRTAEQLRSFHLGRSVDGMVHGRFLLPTDEAEAVRVAIDALAAPCPAHAEPGVPGGAEGPREDSAADRTAPNGVGADGAAGEGSAADPWDGTMPGLCGGAAPVAGPAEQADPRTPTQRRADAFTDLIARALAAGLPDTGGHRPNMYLTLRLDQLRAAHPGTTLNGIALAPSVLRRTACDAGVIPAVLGATGQPLDIGRETRTVPIGIRRALVLRDRGCVFPGCDRPPGWTDAHHIVHWVDGGPTALSNLVLLCRHHHRVTHHQPWTVQIGPDGHPRWRPPPWVAPPGTLLTDRNPWQPAPG